MQASLRRFFAPNNLWYDLTVVALSYAFVTFGAWNDNLLGIAPTHVSYILEMIFAAVLGMEIIARVAFTAKHHQNYWFWPLLFTDFVSILTVIPTLGIVSFARVFRIVVSIGKLLTLLDKLSCKFGTPYPLLIMYPVALPVIAAALYLLEKDEPGSSIHTYFQAIGACFSYGLTVGMSGNRPVTFWGDITCGALFLGGVLAAALVGNTLSARYIRIEG